MTTSACVNTAADGQKQWAVGERMRRMKGMERRYDSFLNNYSHVCTLRLSNVPLTADRAPQLFMLRLHHVLGDGVVCLLQNHRAAVIGLLCDHELSVKTASLWFSHMFRKAFTHRESESSILWTLCSLSFVLKLRSNRRQHCDETPLSFHSELCRNTSHTNKVKTSRKDHLSAKLLLQSDLKSNHSEHELITCCTEPPQSQVPPQRNPPVWCGGCGPDGSFRLGPPVRTAVMRVRGFAFPPEHSGLIPQVEIQRVLSPLLLFNISQCFTFFQRKNNAVKKAFVYMESLRKRKQCSICAKPVVSGQCWISYFQNVIHHKLAVTVIWK